jgi:signal transduction histidine kinase
MTAQEPAYKVLYVDDDAANLSAFSYLFEGRFRIITARSGDEALTLLAREPVAVLITDQRMPHMSGAELCAIARERHPKVVRMIVTAYADLGAAITAINSGQVSRYIVKPWREEQLGEVISAALEAFSIDEMTSALQVKLIASEQQTTSAFVLGRILHEIGNPAASVHANVRWLSDSINALEGTLGPRGKQIDDQLKEIHLAAADAMEGMAELLRRIERFREGDTPAPLAGQKADLQKAVQASLGIVRAELQRCARLRLELSPVPSVFAEPTQLSQILVNLLTNAAEAIGPGAPERNTITLRTSLKDDGYVLLEVEDTGPGIAAELLPKMFDPFVTTKGQDVTRGVGLAVVRDIVERINGKIYVTSERAGTLFSVRLKIAA